MNVGSAPVCRTLTWAGRGGRDLGSNQLQLAQTPGWMSGEDRAEVCSSISGQGKESPTPHQNQPVVSKGRDHFGRKWRMLFSEHVIGILRVPMSSRHAKKNSNSANVLGYVNPQPVSWDISIPRSDCLSSAVIHPQHSTAK